jgi:hypothetical protein
MMASIERFRRGITLALALLALAPAWSAAQDEGLSAMLNEDLAYAVSFLWIDGLAEGRIQLEPGAVAGTYVASLEARTRGLTAFLTRHRRNRYETTMELVERRLRPLRHEMVDRRGTGDNTRYRRTVFEFDYERGEIRFRKTKTGFPAEDDLRPMPDGGVDDVLSAFYNLRAGFLGPLTPGSEYSLSTVASDGSRTIEIRLLDAAERESYDRFPAGGLLARVSVSGEVFGAENGVVLVWFDPHMRPGRTVVEDVLGLGDVTGTLTDREAAPAAAVWVPAREADSR